MLKNANLIGDLIHADISRVYDLVAVSAESPMFSTALYVAIESALVGGGILAIYGDPRSISSRRGLLVNMIREGDIAPFSMGSERDIILFRLDDILVKVM